MTHDSANAADVDLTSCSLRERGYVDEADRVQAMVDHREELGCDDAESAGWIAHSVMRTARFWEVVADLADGRPLRVAAILWGWHNFGSGGDLYHVYASAGLHITTLVDIFPKPGPLDLTVYLPDRSSLVIPASYDPGSARHQIPEHKMPMWLRNRLAKVA